MGAVRFKADMYKQGLFLIALVFLSTSVRSQPLKTAESDPDPPPVTDKAPAGGDEDKKVTEAPVEPVGGGDGGDNGGEEKPHKAEEKIDQAIQQMNALNTLFESIVTSLGGNTDTDDNSDDVVPSSEPPMPNPDGPDAETKAPPPKEPDTKTSDPEKPDDAKKAGA